MRKTFLFVVAGSLLWAAGAYAQDDSPSLGDLARQVRQQKQQKDPQAKDATKSAQSGTAAPSSAAKSEPPRVITNENISHAIVNSAPARQSEARDDSEDEQPNSPAEKNAQADKWKQEIQSQKEAISSLRQQIDELSASIQYVGGNCVANCVEWNERQKQKQDQVESMKAQLADQQKRLEDMQESARKQGFGSSVYDP